jgi:hypothetical protein
MPDDAAGQTRCLSFDRANENASMTLAFLFGAGYSGLKRLVSP